MKQQLVNTKEACALLKTTRQTIHYLRSTGELPFEVISEKKITYRKDDIDSLIANEDRMRRMRRFQLAKGKWGKHGS